MAYEDDDPEVEELATAYAAGAKAVKQKKQPKQAKLAVRVIRAIAFIAVTVIVAGVGIWVANSNGGLQPRRPGVQGPGAMEPDLGRLRDQQTAMEERRERALQEKERRERGDRALPPPVDTRDGDYTRPGLPPAQTDPARGSGGSGGSGGGAARPEPSTASGVFSRRGHEWVSGAIAASSSAGQGAGTPYPYAPTDGSLTGSPDGSMRVKSVEEITADVLKAFQTTGLPAVNNANGPPPDLPVGATSQSQTASAPKGAHGVRTERPLGPGLHRVLEGTWVNGATINTLVSTMAGPVKVMLRDPIYARDDVLVAEAGASILGWTTPIGTNGEDRMAISFHRLIRSDGVTADLQQFQGLGVEGDAGITGDLNHHYLQTFGISAVVGVIEAIPNVLAGRAQSGSGGVNVFAGDVTATSGQAVTRTLDRLLSRPPTLTVRSGTPLTIWVTDDLDLPAVQAPRKGVR
jgi:type IV secretory pathway VirB10-like protein